METHSNNEISLFKDNIQTHVFPSETNNNHYRINVDWLVKCSADQGQYFVGLYCHRREKNKNYSSFIILDCNVMQYTFPIDVPEGYYDVRVCKNQALFDYPTIYEISKIFVGKQPLIVEISFESPSLVINLNKPSKIGDYIGMFDVACDKGTTKFVVPVQCEELTKGSLYEIRYFKSDCCITYCNYLYKWDKTFVPSAFSNYFTYEY
ncbi:Uncharacterized protein QTN25_007032 [Entamoeba marina]